MNLDRVLSDALTRKAPPADLTDRVVARLGQKSGTPAPRPSWRAPQTILRLAAALVAVVAIGFGVLRQFDARRERQRGELAARQLVTALQIASETLNDAQRLVHRQSN